MVVYTFLKTDEIIRKFSSSLEKNTIIWYTDGSTTTERTGTGVFGPCTKYSETMGQFPSVPVEIHAIERSI